MKWYIYYNPDTDRYAAINHNIPATTLMETGHFDLVLAQKGYAYYAYGNILQAILQCSHAKFSTIDPADILFHDWDRGGDFANLTEEKLIADFGMNYMGTVEMATIGSKLEGQTSVGHFARVMNAMIQDWNESQSDRDENASKSVKGE